MPASETPSIACQFGALPSVTVDLLVLPWFEGQSAESFEGLDAATAGEIERALASDEFAGRPYELFVTPLVEQGWSARRARSATWRTEPASPGTCFVPRMWEVKLPTSPWPLSVPSACRSAA